MLVSLKDVLDATVNRINFHKIFSHEIMLFFLVSVWQSWCKHWAHFCWVCTKKTVGQGKALLQFLEFLVEPTGFFHGTLLFLLEWMNDRQTGCSYSDLHICTWHILSQRWCEPLSSKQKLIAFFTSEKIQAIN